MKDAGSVNISNEAQYAADRNGWNSLDTPRGLDKIAHSLGGKVAGSTELGGKISKTIRLDMDDRSVVVKVSPLWFDHSLAREEWCYEKLRKESRVLTPKVFEYFSSQNDIFPGHEILVREFIEGPTLGAISRDKALHRKVGNIYRQIHQVTTQGYGWMDEGFRGKKERWIDFLKDIDKVAVGIEHGLLKKSEYNWLLKEFGNTLDQNFAPRLLHGDFRWDNFILGSKGIVVIDFQNSFSGHDLYDYGIGVVYDPDLLKNLKYYLGDGVGKDIVRSVLLYGMRDAVGTAGFLASRGDMEYAKHFRMRFDDLKREYEGL